MSFIWGSSFVAQSLGMESVDAFTFNGIRTLMGAATLLPVILIKSYVEKKRKTPEITVNSGDRFAELKYGIPLGTVLCIASNFQQFAFYYSTSGKIAFITALYMFFVPIFSIVLKRRVSLITWGCVFLGFFGLYLLCFRSADIGALNKGDILSFCCAVMFAVQIMMVDEFAPKTDGLKLSFVQFSVSGILSIIMMFIFENPQISAINSAILPLLYSGVISCGVAYTLQIVGQKYTEATVASLLMCMESVFAVLCGAVFLHERLTAREIIGCTVMFVAIVMSQVSEIITARKQQKSEV
jgi:drug/metabolite transporter (DMT)-like permease